MLGTIHEGQQYTASDFRPGGLRDFIRAGWLVADGEPEPKRKKAVRRKRTASK